MRYYVTLPPEEERVVDVTHRSDGSVEVRLDGEPVAVDAVDADGALNVRVGDRVFDLWLDPGSDEGALRFVGGGLRMQARVENERARIGARASRAGGGGGGSVRAPMPGRVVKVLVSEGDVVEAGTPIVVVEAMKMENELCAESPGVVATITATAGQTVEGGSTLVELGPLPG